MCVGYVSVADRILYFQRNFEGLLFPYCLAIVVAVVFLALCLLLLSVIALILLYTSDFIYGKLMRISRNTLKSDIINMFEGCKLTPDDIKVDYDKLFSPMAM